MFAEVYSFCEKIRCCEPSSQLDTNFEEKAEKLRIGHFIIQQIVTLSKYGHDALDICHP